MLYVLGRSVKDVEAWRRMVGIPPRCIYNLASPDRGRGTRIRPHDVLLLPGWDEHPKLDAIRVALAPAIQPPTPLERLPRLDA